MERQGLLKAIPAGPVHSSGDGNAVLESGIDLLCINGVCLRWNIAGKYSCINVSQDFFLAQALHNLEAVCIGRIAESSGIFQRLGECLLFKQLINGWSLNLSA